MKISSKIIVYICIFIGISLFAISFSFVQFYSFYLQFSDINSNYSKTENIVSTINKNISDVSNLTLNMIITNGYDQRTDEFVSKLKNDNQSQISQLRSIANANQIINLNITEFESLINVFNQFNSEVLNNIKMERFENAKNLILSKNLDYTSSISQKSLDVSKTLNLQLNNLETNLKNQKNIAIYALIASTTLLISLLILSLYKIINCIVNPIKKISDNIDLSLMGKPYKEPENFSNSDIDLLSKSVYNLIQKYNSVYKEIIFHIDSVSKGSINEPLLEDYPGNFSLLKNSVENMQKFFNKTLHSINDSTKKVSKESNKIYIYSDELSSGAHQQESSINELSLSLSDIYNQTKENALNAARVNNVVLSTRDDAQKGSEQMNKMLLSMDQINKTSENIAKIIKVINDIAFQTNILALNAAVEAARAGATGKGFAVVAEEVRNLAARSAEAAKETTEYIESSISTVREGTEIANHTASALESIISGIQSVTDLISDINTASNSQAQGLSNITSSLGQLSELIHKNSNTSKKSLTTSQNLSSQSEVLKSIVMNFNVEDTN